VLSEKTQGSTVSVEKCGSAVKTGCDSVKTKQGGEDDDSMRLLIWARRWKQEA
ncbi:hypothetical protein PIB30_045370, partial [Stylosanthes scabra]|nr:hypothetical protein [Stylosanthes scabra]